MPVDISPCEGFCEVADVTGRCSDLSSADSLTALVTDERVQDFIGDATDILFFLTGRQFGICEYTVTRVCPHYHDLGDPCLRRVERQPRRLDTGYRNVTEITALTIDGADVPDTYYRLVRGRYLDLTDESDLPAWPTSGIEVTLRAGTHAPRILRRATARLACELAKYESGLPCSLPDQITSMSRRGVTMDMASSEDLLAGGLIGIYEVDLAIRVLNPRGLQSKPTIWAPELRRPRRPVTRNWSVMRRY